MRRNVAEHRIKAGAGPVRRIRHSGGATRQPAEPAGVRERAAGNFNA
jgi:hypothetical protein